MIVVDDARFRYQPGGPDVLAGVDLTIADGEHVALLGRNGSGKSSLARLLNGLHRPTGGSVLVDGLDVADPARLPAVRRSVQMVFQTPENQQVGTTVFDDIAFGLANIAVPTAQMPARAAAALAEVGLPVGLERQVVTLSGGELQRLALAAVLALRPRHLVLDEVTAMLDPAGRGQVLAAIRRIRAESGLAVIQITHHLDEIEDADRAIVIDRGRVLAEGSVPEILADSALLAACGLQAPYRWRAPGPRRRPEATTVDPDPVLELSQVRHDYAASPRRRFGFRRPAAASTALVLDGVDLTLRAGELVAIAGRSGAGKSTLLTILKGLLRPTSGSVTVRGADPWAQRRPELFDPIGYVFQHPERQLFAATVRADVGFGLRNRGLPAELLAAKVDASLQSVGLDPEEFGEHSPFGLSGGQQRRAAFAGVFVTEPGILILDEPTAGLDHPSRERLFGILAEARARGLCVLWVSHRLEEILDHADRLLVLDEGRIVAGGPVSATLSDAALRTRLGWPLLPELDPSVAEGCDRVRHLAEVA
ncbi:MAG: ATP-binding cassette domain-containing protein [Propionibacteriaceae bacterium]|nr:ATP-binding cassette domain-containing protein [Propionibacteriaceae bacterium]